MTELPPDLTQSAYAKGGGILAAALAFMFWLPRLMNQRKGDQIEGNVLKRLDEAEQKIIELSDSIHEHAIDLTLAQMVILKLYHSAKDAGHAIPTDVQDYVDEMMERRARKKDAKDSKI